MLVHGLAVLLAGAALANPLPQGLDPSDKSLERRAGCRSDSKSPQQWQAGFNTAGASTPKGYERVFTNLKAANKGLYGYMGYSVIDGTAYNTQECAKRCSALKGCQSFNLYYERAPSVAPTDTCTNPTSVTRQKCVYYGGPVSEATATNNGQWQRNFRVLIAGSNGYIKCSTPSSPGQPGTCKDSTQYWSTSAKSCVPYVSCKDNEYLRKETNTCIACDMTKEYLDKTQQKCVPLPACDTDKQYFDKAKNQCVSYPTCNAATQYLDKSQKACVSYPACSTDQYLDKDQKTCVAYPTCDAEKQYLDKTKKQCVAYPTCGTDSQYLDKATNKCVGYPACDASTQYLDKTQKKCLDYPTCDATKQYLDKITNKCVDYPMCDLTKQYLDKTTNKCVNYPSCDSTKQYLDKSTNKCMDYPTCDSTKQYLDKTTNKCADFPTCDTSTQYLDTDTKKCVPYPTCKDTEYLDKTKNACVSYPSCSAGQSLNKDSKKCEAPVCVQKNLVSNGGFEDGPTGSNIPGWMTYGSGAGNTGVSSSNPDTGLQHFLGTFRYGQNGIQLAQQVKGLEAGKTYRFTMRYALGANRNFGGVSCTIGISFRSEGKPYGPYLNADDLVAAPAGTYKTEDWFVTAPASNQLSADGEYINFSMSCGDSQALSVDVLIDSVSIVDPSCSGTLVPQFPSCNADTQWLDQDKNVCIDYPVCDASKFEVLDKYQKTCGLSPAATCANLAQLSTGANTFTASGTTFQLSCASTVTGQSIFTTSVQGFADCVTTCSHISWPSKCVGVSYSASDKKCTLLSSATKGDSSTATDGALI